ncbi:hypothetical protein TNCV_2335831 [Trichonephila clavipes]|uniref:Uncharacterized protein n=1 Tax=Trichonephila clavipes TaxID=2585209 RepID=A0A8X6SGM2_TRICX|nr:hypothetical protein TNCV_2335831 [Trichonephila clavipes]
MESIRNKWYCHQEGHHRESTFKQDRYLALSARGHMQTTAPQLVTLLLCLEEEFPEKHSLLVLQRLASTPGVQFGTSL